MKRPPQPADGQAPKRINELTNIGDTLLTAHWKQRAAERRFTYQDARSVIRRGRIVNGEWDYKHGNWKWVMEGADIDGKRFRIVVAYGDGDQLVLISGMRRERGQWQLE